MTTDQILEHRAEQVAQAEMTFADWCKFHEKYYFSLLVQRFQGNLSKVAEAAQVSRVFLYEVIKRHKLTDAVEVARHEKRLEKLGQRVVASRSRRAAVMEASNGF